MIQRIKGILKEPLIRQQNNRYYALLDEKVTNYDDWIRYVERCEDEKYGQAGQNGEDTSDILVIDYDACDESFDFAGIKAQYVVFTKDKSRMADGCLSYILRAFTDNPQAQLIYGDEDEWNSNCTIRMNPWFKPDFSPDTLASFFYFGNLFAVKTNLFRSIVWLGEADPLANLYDFVLHGVAGKSAAQILHVKRVLYHADNLKALCTQDIYDELRIEAQMAEKKLAIGQKMEQSQTDGSQKPMVSIIIPSKDHPDILQNCIASIWKWTTEITCEIIVVDNGSTPENKAITEEMAKKANFTYVYQEMPFHFSRMCNLGAERALGTFLLFLNDDIEVRQSKWLSLLVQKAALLRTGAVGAKLYYPDSKMLQHAGITNLRLGPVHKLQFKEDKRSYYYERNTRPVNVLAVTGACLMIAKDRFYQVGGFDEALPVAFNDVELCFRLYEAGYDNVCRNDVHLWHYESLSRGGDEDREKQNRLLGERQKLYQKHPDLYGKDPYYHPYLNNDILDTNYSGAYQYEAARVAETLPVNRWKGTLKDCPENECLIISMEYAGSLNQWLDITAEDGDEIYFQGYAFVAGSDNSCYRKKILLRNQESKEIYEIDCNEIFRPDLELNLDPQEMACLCGFAVVIEKKALPGGNWQVGIYAKDCCSSQRLYRFTEKYITI